MRNGNPARFGSRTCLYHRTCGDRGFIAGRRNGDQRHHGGEDNAQTRRVLDLDQHTALISVKDWLRIHDLA